MARDQAESHNVDGCWVVPVRGCALWEGSLLLSPADAEMVVASSGTQDEQPPCKGCLPIGRSSDSDPHPHSCSIRASSPCSCTSALSSWTPLNPIVIFSSASSYHHPFAFALGEDGKEIVFSFK